MIDKTSGNYRNGGKWTEGRYRSFITSTIRASMRKWGPWWETLKLAYAGRLLNKKTNRMAQHYTCADCKKNYPATDVQVDHIEPVVDPVVGFVSWDVYIDRMFCEVHNLQVLCKKCHTKKTKLEREASKKAAVKRVKRSKNDSE